MKKHVISAMIGIIVIVCGIYWVSSAPKTDQNTPKTNNSSNYIDDSYEQETPYFNFWESPLGKEPTTEVTNP